MIIWRILNHIYIHVQYNLTSTKTMCKEKKRSSRNIPNIQKTIILFFKFSVYFNSCEETNY